MNRKTRSLFKISPLLIGVLLANAHCGGDDVVCGPGSVSYGDRCIAKISSCAPGTELVDGECGVVCGPNESWNGSTCVAEKTCAPGTELVDGQCVVACESGTYWDGEGCAIVPACAPGTVFDEEAGACLPDESICADGTHFDGGVCVPDTDSCGPGTHLDGGSCVPDELPPADVSESTSPDGTAHFDLPAEGQEISLGGRVDTPEDRDGDGYVDPDYDRFTFTAQAGTWLRLSATSEGAAHPAFVVVSDAVDANGSHLYARYAVNANGVDTQREVYLPRAGDYTIILSDYTHITADLFGWLSLPVGGYAFAYYATVENLGTPTPTSFASMPASTSGVIEDGALGFVELTGLQQHDVRVLRNLGTPMGKMGSDVFAALMLFGPDGALQRESLAFNTDEDAMLLFAATSPGDHLVVIDHLLTIGPNLDYGLSAEAVTTVECGTSDCSAGSIDEDVGQLLSWDVAEGSIFVAGAYVPDTAVGSLRVQLMDEGLVPVGDSSLASKYGPAKLRQYVDSDQRLYMLLRGYQGAEVPAYTLDAEMPLADLLPSGIPQSGLAVHEMPVDTYPPAGWGRFLPLPGQVVISTGFSTAFTAWTDPVEQYLSTSFEAIPPMLDVSDPAFPDSALQPLAAFMPTAETHLYRATDGAGADISGATYSTAFHALTPLALGSPAPGAPLSALGQALDAGSGWAIFSFMAPIGQSVTVTVTPQGGGGMQPEVWVGTPGRRESSAGVHSWVSDAEASALGVLARGSSSSAGAPVTLSHTVDYDGVQLVFVHDVGLGVPGDTFDIAVSAQ